jgi:hypothetical protein
LRAQVGALLYAEPMLLVHDHEAEAVELDRFLDECVRAHNDSSLSRADLLKKVGAT